MLIVLLIGFALFVVYAPHLWTRKVLNRYNRREYFSGNGVELARLALDQMGITDVKVEETETVDHYDPSAKCIRLTNTNCGRRTLTAIVVAAHEVGHAVQDHTQYPPLKVRTRIVGTATKLERVGAALMIGVPVVTALTRIPAAGALLLIGGFATLCIPLVVHLITLPTEFDASFKRALPILKSGPYIPEEDVPAGKKILTACALTYVASALIGLLNVWRWMIDQRAHL
jgi:uncharacterized protein